MGKFIVKKVSLTAAGTMRIDSIFNKISMTILAMLENEIPRLKDRIADFAPTAEEEAMLISYPGSTYNFMKGSFSDVPTAIRNEAYSIRMVKDVISVALGKINDINPLIGFSWRKGNKNGGFTIRSTSDPEAGEAWKHLLEYWEYGGSGTFTVTARDGGNLTLFDHKEDTGGLPRTVKSISKSIPWVPRGLPFAMYQNGGLAFRDTLLLKAREAVKSVQL